MSLPLDPAIIAPFLMAMVLVELTPGPNMGWLALVTLARGRTAGLAAVAGITVGLAAWMTAALLGLGRFVLAYPAVHEVIRWAGVGFLLWLAWEAWRGDGTADQAEPEATRRALFLRGMVGNLLNPKAAVFYVALLPTFIPPRLRHAPDPGPDPWRAAPADRRGGPRAGGVQRGGRRAGPDRADGGAARAGGHGRGTGADRRVDGVADAALSAWTGRAAPV
ncbi:LysE family translocator [Brevundimonas denitrificans]|uniref:LysE family translocator n=1 Tax=Brevundimonas denitrificans TaxID=1443434 RepID=UPI00223BB6FD|nr:LysE family translocator [Brevundimonas denitrificans]